MEEGDSIALVLFSGKYCLLLEQEILPTSTMHCIVAYNNGLSMFTTFNFSSINADHKGAVCGTIKTLYKHDVKIMALIMSCCSFNTSERCSCTFLLVETLQHGCYNCKRLLQACIYTVSFARCILNLVFRMSCATLMMVALSNSKTVSH